VPRVDNLIDARRVEVNFGNLPKSSVMMPAQLKVLAAANSSYYRRGEIADLNCHNRPWPEYRQDHCYHPFRSTVFSPFPQNRTTF
jgi:hypothetical protein